MVRWMRLLLLRATCFATGRMVVPRSSVVVVLLLLVIEVVVVVRDVLGGTHGPAFWCLHYGVQMVGFQSPSRVVPSVTARLA
jgi:hypothetical protein